MRVQVRIVVEPDGDSFHAYAPDLPGLHTCGQTEDEAIRNATDAVMAYLESMQKHDEPLPIGSVIVEDQRRPSRPLEPGPGGRVQSVVLPLV